jgi:hypothetical protein
MATSGVREIPYFPSSPDAITGELSGASGIIGIELWDENGTSITLASSGCNQMGNTNFYAWPISGLQSIPDIRSFYHWRMTAASGSTDAPEGDVILFSVEGDSGQMPSLNDKDSYILSN